MNKKWIVLILLSVVSLSTLGCQKKEVNNIDSKDQGVVEIRDENSSNDNTTDGDDSNKKSSAQVMSEFESVKEKSAFEILQFIDTNINYVDSLDADALVLKFISKSQLEVESSNEYLFSENSLKINDIINKTAVYDDSYSIFGEKKYKLLKDLDDNDIKSNLSEIFDRGQGLISAEGSYYAVVDYLDIYNKYGDSVSSSLLDYLEIASIETTNPSTIEEYLAVTPEELKVRVIRYEEFLKKNGNAPYASQVRLLYMTSIWKIVNPSMYDSQLNEDYTVSSDMMKFYNDTKSMSQYPVLYDSVNGILKFINSKKGGVIGSLEDSNELINNAEILHEKAGVQIDKLYMNK